MPTLETRPVPTSPEMARIGRALDHAARARWVGVELDRLAEARRVGAALDRHTRAHADAVEAARIRAARAALPAR